MHFGKFEPVPTISDRPQAFAPRTFASQRSAWAAYVVVPVSWSYSLAMTDSPAPWVVVSQTSHGKPNPNGSVAPWARAPSSAFFMSPRSAAWVVARPAGSPAAVIARSSSKWASPLTS